METSEAILAGLASSVRSLQLSSHVGVPVGRVILIKLMDFQFSNCRKIESRQIHYRH